MSYASLQVDRATRLEVRRFCAGLVSPAKEIALTCRSDAIRDLLTDMALKGKKGRDRAIAKLRRALELLGARWTPLGDIPAWCYLRPTGSIYVDAAALGRTQDCILTDGIVWNGSGLSRGPWGLEIPVHSLARILQRSDRGVDLANVVFDGFRNALTLDAASVMTPFLNAMERDGAAPWFRLPARCGCFSAQLVTARGASSRARLRFIRCGSWLHLDNLNTFQEGELMPAGPPGRQLVDVFLRPPSMSKEISR